MAAQDLWHYSVTLKACYEKLRNLELRADRSQGQSHDCLRHLKQTLSDFDPQQGGAALLTEFLCTERWSLLSGPVSAWTTEVSLDQLSYLFFFGKWLFLVLWNVVFISSQTISGSAD